MRFLDHLFVEFKKLLFFIFGATASDFFNTSPNFFELIQKMGVLSPTHNIVSLGNFYRKFDGFADTVKYKIGIGRIMDILFQDKGIPPDFFDSLRFELMANADNLSVYVQQGFGIKFGQIIMNRTSRVPVIIIGTHHKHLTQVSVVIGKVL